MCSNQLSYLALNIAIQVDESEAGHSTDLKLAFQLRKKTNKINSLMTFWLLFTQQSEKYNATHRGWVLEETTYQAP